MRKIRDQPILNRFQSAQVLARDAGLYAMQWFRTNKNLQTEKKGPQNWVSIADHEVEKMIRGKLEKLFPEDGFLGEESGTRNLDAEGIWVVDPIDGTSCFLNGIPSWCVSIAYVLKNRIEIGVIYSPCSDELFAAHRGHGATLNGQPMLPSKATSLSEYNKIVFKVHKGASKSSIKKIIEKIFKVNVIKINTINLKKKNKLVRNKKSSKPGYKKAIVTLKKGQSIDLATGI